MEKLKWLITSEVVWGYFSQIFYALAIVRCILVWGERGFCCFICMQMITVGHILFIWCLFYVLYLTRITMINVLLSLSLSLSLSHISFNSEQKLVFQIGIYLFICLFIYLIKWHVSMPYHISWTRHISIVHETMFI